MSEDNSVHEDSVTEWLRALADGDEQAVRRIWERYFQRLVALARRHLSQKKWRAVDEEDVALSAFASFCKRAGAGEFPKLENRDDLWKLLVTITCRKAIVIMRRESRQKRGGGTVRGESAFRSRNEDSGASDGIGQVLGKEPSPDFAAQVAEELKRLLDRVGDESLREIALYKLQGYTNEEIASRVGVSLRTVKRRLKLIRHKWGGS